ncbi:MAG TPA: type II and III secretion system protein family protein, partial [Nevskiaceae bacterium]|nr:type II and III secretion system protein family protein [Nevskiaceae bacterium]
MNINYRALAGALLCALFALAGVSSAADNEDRNLTVPLYKSVALRLDGSAKGMSVGNPGVADVVMLGSDTVQVVGKALGSTNLILWDAAHHAQTVYNVEVVHDLATLKQRLHQMLPEDRIEVQSAQENIVLGGEAGNLARMQAALDLAQSFIGQCIESETNSGHVGANAVAALPGAGKVRDCDKGKVINLMQVGGAQQVMIEIKVAEVSRDVVKRLDANLNIFNLSKHSGIGAVQGGATFPNALDPNGLQTPVLGALNGSASPIGPPVQAFQPNTPTIDSSGLFMSYLTGNMFLEAVLDISRRNGLAKILSEPTLTTLNGQEAQFLSGGEFPVPVPQGGATNAITIDFKEFGVGVKFLPVILDSGRINLKLNVSVSELSQSNNVAITPTSTNTTFVIPSLTKRSAVSTVELSDGQTIGIAGLISDNVREFVDKLPGLGDIPGLGALFRSQEFLSGQTELVIFVTPHLARPIAANKVRLPTDSFVPPGDLDFYLMGRLERPRSGSETRLRTARGGPEGAH